MSSGDEGATENFKKDVCYINHSKRLRITDIFSLFEYFSLNQWHRIQVNFQLFHRQQCMCSLFSSH